MPEKQICENCKHPIDEFDEGWLHINSENVERKHVDKICRNLHKSGTKTCYCNNPEPQILCRNCKKPKEEHTASYYGDTFFCDTLFGEIKEFEPAPNSAPDKVKR